LHCARAGVWAVRVHDVGSACDALSALDVLTPDEEALLIGRERPIVLLMRSAVPALAIASEVAPGQSTLGVMLPHSPLHHLLAAYGPLVLTSGNLSEEPIARSNEEALERLASLADGFLLHDRDIHVVCDDSVVRVHAHRELPLRRSRGYAPYPVRLPMPAPSVLAVGGELKATACLTRDHYAFLTPHIGDVGNLETLAALQRACDHLERLFRVSPSRIACDMHPGYLSTQWGRRLAAERGLPLVQVQHHHAHLAALMAEHALGSGDGILAFAFDGTGYGTDGTIWGGEVLLGGYREYERVAHLAATPLPGGDAAVRRPARIALAQLWSAGEGWDGTHAAGALSAAERGILRTQLERRLNCVDTTSMGRFLDAVASLAGVRHAVTYEGQAAIELEALARAGDSATLSYAFALADGADGAIVLDGAPILRGVAADAARGREMRDIARAVHEAVAAAVVDVATTVRASRGVNLVGLTGGVFQNVLLLSLAQDRLRAARFDVLAHHKVPPNDGGLALGQAMVAAFS
ncbi:MAG: Sua5/YciO/YrdC/YwlC family protein, partial [Gemmatimonadota bacterium]